LQEFRKSLVKWYRKRAKELPWRQRWQESLDPYAVWVSEIMLQQTQIAVVIPAYNRFMAQFPNVTALSNADEETVRLACRGLGYYRRFAFLHRAAQTIVRQRQGSWPTQSYEWLELPGVGRYTAAAIASICFNEPLPAVDGNVERIVCRLNNWEIRLQDPGTKPRVTTFANKLLDPKDPGTFNQAMMELGQDVCTKANPNCPQCPVKAHCSALRAGTQDRCPAPPKPKQMTSVNLNLVALVDGDSRLGLVTRPSDAKFLKGVPGLLTRLETKNGKLSWDGSADIPLKLIGKVRLLDHTFTHTITSHKISVTLAIAKISAAGDRAILNQALKWVSLKEADQAIVANLDRKAWMLIKEELKRI
jgi:A/G-specific adenine glycosylase